MNNQFRRLFLRYNFDPEAPEHLGLGVLETRQQKTACPSNVVESGIRIELKDVW
jgi:hypothetical protein